MNNKIDSQISSSAWVAPKATLEVNPKSQSVQKYTRLVLGLETQIREVNESKLNNTTIIAGIGDFIGEKTGAFATGKDVYKSMIDNTSTSAKELHAKIMALFSNGIGLS